MKETEFSIDVVGDASGEQFKGKFKCRTRLSYRLDLQRDQRRRELLGTNLEHVSPEALAQAAMLAELGARLTSWPKWWPEVGFGLDMEEDDNVLIAIHDKIKEAIKTERAEVAKGGETASKKVRKVAQDAAKKDDEEQPSDDE
jgi:hypothetical protein